MKNLSAIILSLVMILSLFVGCSKGSEDESAPKNNNESASNFASVTVNNDSENDMITALDEDEDEDEDEDFDLDDDDLDFDEEDDSDFDEDAVVKNIAVTPYTYTTKNDNDLLLVLENKSNSDCELEVAVDFYDSKGKLIGTESDTIDAFAKGTKTISLVSSDEKFASYEYELTASEMDFVKCTTQNLKVDVTPAKNKAIVSVTNNGTKKPNLITAYALFFKETKLVAYNYEFIDSMASGKTKKKEIKADYIDEIDFDSVQVYLDSYAY